MPDAPDNVVVNAPAADQVTVDQSKVDDLVGLIPTVVKESKEGYKTTEFWVTVLGSLATVLNGIPLPEKYEGWVVAAFGVAYVISRGIAKKGVPAVAGVAPEA